MNFMLGFTSARHPTGKTVTAWAMMALLSVGTSGCGGLQRPKSKRQADHQWASVRSRVKLQLARQQYERGLFDDAVKTVDEALVLDPQSVEGWVLLARSEMERGRLASAEQVLHGVAESGRSSPDLFYTLGVVLEQSGSMEDALHAYERAGALAPDRLESLVARVECLVALDRIREARTLLDGQSDRVADDEGSVAWLSARLARLEGDLGRAERDSRVALARSSGAPRVAAELGLLLADQNRCPEAIGLLTPILSSSSEWVDEAVVRKSMAQCFLRSGEPFRALDTLLTYADRKTDDRPAQILLAQAALEVGSTSTAGVALQRAEDVQPGQRDARLLRSVLAWRRGDIDSAESTLRPLFEGDDQDAVALYDFMRGSGSPAETGSSDRTGPPASRPVNTAPSESLQSPADQDAPLSDALGRPSDRSIPR